jgi:hypothetical protein
VWFWQGERHEVASARAFQQWVSQSCQEVYAGCPPLRNELVNRENLSSAASAARRNLIERMLDYGNTERLGMEGYPPEAAIYESMLRVSGLHAKRKDEWGFGTPGRDWKPVWQVMEKFVKQARDRRQGITALFSQLKAPPFGMRDGPLPVLFTAILLAKGDEIALYEDGLFVPELRIETLERLVRRPETFEVRSHELSASQTRAVRAITKVIKSELAESAVAGRDDAALVRAVRALVVFASQLPPFARQTRRLRGSYAAAVRDHLLSATDPSQLLFSELPLACGLEHLKPSTIATFAERLALSIRELGRAYTDLLDELEAQLRVVFGLVDDADAAPLQLERRARVVLGVVADPKLAVFVREAAQSGRQANWVERIARAVNGGLPPSHWRDVDVSQFQARLRELASEFVRLEELAAEQRRTGAPQILRFGLLETGMAERRAIIPLRDQGDSDVTQLVRKLGAALGAAAAQSDDDRRIQLEALGRVAAELLRVPVADEVSS